ncbi:hypothetical protein [Actinomadura sp. GTD37]|uniref:hypothetical protein n=1 Tax=Actinomadura sp. GTD37 TaxID=1778030 RepID=UPI0035BF6591
MNYQTPSLTAGLGRAMVALAARPAGMAGLLTAQGFAVEQDVDLLHLARRLDSPTRHSRSLRNGRVAVARFTGPAPAGH